MSRSGIYEPYSCDSKRAGSSSLPPPAEVSKAYCAENKLLVEKLSSNAINKEVAIVGGGTGLAGCGALILLAGLDWGVSAGVCTLVVAGTTLLAVSTVDEAAIVQKVIDEHLDSRCVA